MADDLVGDIYILMDRKPLHDYEKMMDMHVAFTFGVDLNPSMECQKHLETLIFNRVGQETDKEFFTCRETKEYFSKNVMHLKFCRETTRETQEENTLNCVKT